MVLHNDLTFFTNEPDRTLLDRFNKILNSNTQFFDVLVGYFRTSGFLKMYPAMESIEKTRILVGLNVDKKTVEMIKNTRTEEQLFNFSQKEVKEEFSEEVKTELEKSEDTKDVELGIKKFIEFIKTGKLEIRIYPHAPIHAKVYIMRKDLNKSPDYFGSVITGSSNFSQSGLINNLEFNVELKDSRDVNFALEKFEELWSESIDISEEYIETINKKTWIREDITPYELYLKCLYEYFKEEINQDKNELLEQILPDGFMQLQYQMDAVNRAKKILDAYNGVFISDVVGLGKTFICAMLAQKLRGKKLIICPPILIDYWKAVLLDFDVSARVESLGKLEGLLDEGTDEYKYIFIDEAHRFRNQSTEGFSKLHQICLGKKVVLISATPQNNYSSDIANQIYLFQQKNNSTIPNQRNLESFFGKLDRMLKKYEKGSLEYQNALKKNSLEIRDKVLRNIMVRRTRKEIVEHYKNDLEKQGLNFPNLNTPQKIIYGFDDQTEQVFQETIRAIHTLDYARYNPIKYLKKIEKKFASMVTAQSNMRGFMKSILIKRLESSFFAFKKTLGRFIKSYEHFIAMCENGDVYISKKVDVYDLLDNGDDEKLMDLIESNIVQHFKLSEFRYEFLPALKKDLAILKELLDDWDRIEYDSKFLQFRHELNTNPILKNNMLIVFTESKETAEYLFEQLDKEYPQKVIVYTGQSGQRMREEIEANFNPKIKKQKNDLSILITTDVLSEGINLHRSNVIINYDLPWNPTKIMQRVGRVNRVGTAHEDIFVFNFFPTAQSSQHLTLENNIIAKIQAFHDTLGEDFKYLSEDEEVVSHKLFGQEFYNKINSKDALEAEDTQEERSELKYLNLIRQVRDQNVDLFEKIKKLPKKARSARFYKNIKSDCTLSFIRKGALKKFFISDNTTKELTFFEAIDYFEVEEGEPKHKLKNIYYEQLKRNKEGFLNATVDSDTITIETAKRSSNDAKVLKLLKAISKCRCFTDIQEEQLKKLKQLWENGVFPSGITKEVIKKTTGMTDPLTVFYAIMEVVPERYIDYRDKKSQQLTGNTQVILSSYLSRGEK